MLKLGVMKLIKYLKNMVYDNYREACEKLQVPFNKYEHWRQTAVTLGLSKKACLRLEWIIFYYAKAQENASLTCRHFAIQRSQFYYWFSRFDETNLRTMEDRSKSPVNTRRKEFAPRQYERLIRLRKKYIRYGKVKLLKIYQRQYPEDKAISDWKIQCMIKRSGLYFKPAKQAKINAKRQRALHKKRITELKKRKRTGFLICLDTVIKYWNSQKRYIITAIDRYSKVAFARMYTTHSSYNTMDFLLRLNCLLDGKIENIQTDNGSEFMKYFEKTREKLNFEHYFSRVKTPKDNPFIERFNRTLKEEFIALGNMTDNTVLFNQRLTDWLIEYNFHRPHQTLDYATPMEFATKCQKVSEMWSSNTKT